MQPNKNLVFHLTGDDGLASGVSEQSHNMSAGVQNNGISPSPVEVGVSPEQSEEDAGEAVRNVLPIRDHDEEVDWIATLESLRHQRRHDDEAEQTPIAQSQPSSAQTKAFNSSLSGVLKVHSVKATQLFNPAAQAIAAGKDLETLSSHLQETRTAPSKSVTNVLASKQADIKLEDTELSKANHAASTTEWQEAQALKIKAKQIPIEPLNVDAYAPTEHLSDASNDDDEQEQLIAKAQEVAEKTALTMEERHRILEDFLALWQTKRGATEGVEAEKKLMFKEDWMKHQDNVLQTDTPSSAADQVLWLKTIDQTQSPELEQTQAVPESIETLETLPENISPQAMYAPIHLHVSVPSLGENESISIISEAQLVEQLTQRLKPYFVDVLTGMVKTELVKQTSKLVQCLQQNIADEIPIMVDEVLQDNLSKALQDLKQSQ